MKIFFIRHGETEHNVAQLLAGATDSRLTNHGVLQTQRLGAHLTTTKALRFSHIYASDLQRAFMTAQAVADAQAKKYEKKLEVVRLPHLREQDFGSNEMVPWNSKRGQDSFFDRTPDTSLPGYVPKEGVVKMKARAKVFMDEYIVPLLATDAEETVAIVSHGLFLGVLWRDLLARFGERSVSLSPNAVGNSYGVNFNPLEHIGIWANTAYLEVEIQRRSTPNGMGELPHDESEPSNAQSKLYGRTMAIKTINGQEHVQGFKKTRGGLGNVAHDPKQKDIAGFFKKPTAEHENPVEQGEVLERALDTEIEAQAEKPGAQRQDQTPMGGVLR